MKIVDVQFVGFNLWVTLELRGEPGAFVPLGWCDDEINRQNDFEREDWKRFYKATDDAFDDLFSNTVHINASKIVFIRERTK